MKKRIVSLFTCFALVLTLGGGMFFSAFTVPASAAETESTTEYSDVLEDLKKDVTFNAENYPRVPDAKTHEVIRIAEGDNGELFLYVYQPGRETKDVTLSKVQLALSDWMGAPDNYRLYDLTRVSSNGVFDKYLVNGLSVPDKVERYYTIAGVYEPGIVLGTVAGPILGSIVDTVYGFYHVVRKAWRVYNDGDSCVYESEKVNIVEIDIEASGTVRYKNGLQLFIRDTDNHYVGFSIENYDVDKIIDADITYEKRKKTITYYFGKTVTYSDWEPTKETLSETDTGSNTGDGLFGKKYTWKRIVSADEFIKQVEDDANGEFTENEKAALENCDFVFQFLETSYSLTYDPYSGTTCESVYETGNFGVLRLHFVSGAETYNFGAISDLVGTDTEPDMEVTVGDNIKNSHEELFFDGFDWSFVKIALTIILGLLILGLLIYIATPVITFLLNILFEPLIVKSKSTKKNKEKRKK